MCVRACVRACMCVHVRVCMCVCVYTKQWPWRRVEVLSCSVLKCCRATGIAASIDGSGAASGGPLVSYWEVLRTLGAGK